jgi:flagellar basal-body rod modification protein FlgD
MEVTGTSATTTATQSATTASSGTKKAALSSDFETFLRMLTTQMQNQDPLNPMESTEFATQLATFSSVEQQTKANDLLTAMTAQLGIIGMTQIAGWVGMEARSAGYVWVDNRAVEFTPNPASGADRMAIIVRNEAGLEVGRYETIASDEPSSWTPTGSDGQPLPAGSYAFDLESMKDGEVIATDALETYSRIAEVRNEGGSTVLVLEGGVTLEPSYVTALRKPTA